MLTPTKTELFFINSRVLVTYSWRHCKFCTAAERRMVF